MGWKNVNRYTVPILNAKIDKKKYHEIGCGFSVVDETHQFLQVLVAQISAPNLISSR